MKNSTFSWNLRKPRIISTKFRIVSRRFQYRPLNFEDPLSQLWWSAIHFTVNFLKNRNLIKNIHWFLLNSWTKYASPKVNRSQLFARRKKISWNSWSTLSYTFQDLDNYLQCQVDKKLRMNRRIGLPYSFILERMNSVFLPTAHISHPRNELRRYEFLWTSVLIDILPH